MHFDNCLNPSSNSCISYKWPFLKSSFIKSQEKYQFCNLDYVFPSGGSRIQFIALVLQECTHIGEEMGKDKIGLANSPITGAELSISLVKVMSILITFVVGIVIGLASSAHLFNLQDQQLNLSVGTLHTATSTEIRAVKSEGEGCLKLESFVRPRNLTHGGMKDDDELMWRASMVPLRKELPFRRVPKVAFMFLSRGELPFLALWERFFKGQDEEKFSIYLHAMPGFRLDVAKSSVFYGCQIPSQPAQWGSVSLVDAEKRLLAHALLNFSNERFILLSESCIPIYNFSTVYKYLTRSNHSFVESYDEPTRYGRGRYNRKMLPDIKLRDWRKGSQWFELHRDLAIQIISDTRYYTLFRKHCRPSCYPDEHYIPTYLNMFHGSLNANRTVTYVDWSERASHPAHFGADNITESFVQTLRDNGTACSYNLEKTTTCFLFARKFDPNALEPLLNLASKVMGF